MDLSKIQNYARKVRASFEFKIFRIGICLPLSVLLVLALGLGGCSGSKSKLVQKRLYRPGWNIDLPLKKLKQVNEDNNDDLAMMEAPVELQSLVFEKPVSQKMSLIHVLNDSGISMPKSVSSKNSIQPVNNQAEESETKPEKKHFVDIENLETKDEPSAPIITAGVIAIIIALINLLFFMWVPFLGVLSAILSIVFAVKALKLDNKNSKLYGIASIVISVFTLLISVLMTYVVMNGLQLFGNI